MFVKADKKKSFVILGLARSGTTILCNYFNSMDNSFCISEIMRLAHTGEKKKMRYDKVGDLKIDKAQQVIPKIKNKIENSDYQIGGFKETYVPQTRGYIDEIVTTELDFAILLFRNPFCVQAARKRSKWKHSAEETGKQFVELWDILQRQIVPTYPVIYEKFCKDRGIYINSVMSPEIEISGDDINKVNKTNYHLACPRAVKSDKVFPANMDYSNVSDREKDILSGKPMDVYNDILKRDPFHD